jgi:hypothetical protein
MDGEPLRSFLEKLNVNFEGEHLFPTFSWDIRTASAREDKSELTFTGWFFAATYPWDQSEPDPESIWFMENDDESKTFLIAFDGIIRIDQAGGAESEVTRVFTDPELMPNLSDRQDNDFIFRVRGC